MNIFRKKKFPEHIPEDVSPEKQNEKRWDVLLRIASVLFAILIWFWVVGFQSQVTTRKFSGIKVEIENLNILNSRGYDILGDSDFLVDVTLEGKNSDLNRISSSHIQAYIDVKDIEEAGRVPLQVMISLTVNYAAVTDQSHDMIMLDIDKNIQRRVLVTGEIIKILKDPGTKTGDLIFTPATITVSGPEKIVDTIDHAQVSVDLGTNNIERSRNVTERFVLIDENGNEVRNQYIKSMPNTVEVYIPVYTTKEVPLRVNYKYGYYNENNVSVKITPETILLQGSPDYLNNLEEIIIETIDEKQHESDRTFTRPILLPGDTINLSEITSAEIELTFTDMITKNLTIPVSRFRITPPKDFEYHIQEENLRIRLFGPANRINSITQNSVMLSVDLSNLTERGTYPMTVDAVVTATDSPVFCVGEYTVIVEIY